MSANDLATLATAIQWAGFYADRDGCEREGPALTAVRDATAIVEHLGAVVYHSGRVRERMA